MQYLVTFNSKIFLIAFVWSLPFRGIWSWLANCRTEISAHLLVNRSLPVRPSIHPSVYLFACLPAYIWLPVHPSVLLFVHLPMYWSAWKPARPPAHLSVHPPYLPPARTLPACLPACQADSQAASQPACLPVSLLDSQLASQPTSLFFVYRPSVCKSVRLSVRLSVSLLCFLTTFSVIIFCIISSTAVIIIKGTKYLSLYYNLLKVDYIIINIFYEAIG